jgi:hypothetical protein
MDQNNSTDKKQFGKIVCCCGRPARITARGQTLCYECFDEKMGYVIDPVGYAARRMREGVREFDRIKN